MKRCPYCGSELNDDARFCVECGKPLPADVPVEAAPAAEPVDSPVEAAPAAEPVYAPVEAAPAAEPAPEPVAAVPVPIVEASEAPEAPADMPVITEKPSRKQMLSTFQYVLLGLLYGLPVIGLIFLFVFGAGRPKNQTLKRFSAAMLILRLLFWIVVLALLIVAMVKNGRLLSTALGQLVPGVENLLKALFA